MVSKKEVIDKIPEKSSMIKEYFDIYSEKLKEFGEKTCILYENGAFYEIYQIDNEYEKIGNASILSKILNDMKYASKIIGKIKVHFIGFNTSCLDKFLPMLLSADYTVVLVNQLEDSLNRNIKGNLKRGVTKIYSPSLQPLDYNSGNLLHILIDIENVKTSDKKNSSILHRLNTSICCVKNEYNNIELTENIFKCDFHDGNSLNLVLEEMERIVYRYFPKEIQIRIKFPENIDFWGFKIIDSFFKNNYEQVMIKILSNEDIKQYDDISYQNNFLREVYSHINFGLLTPIEYMNIQNCNLSIINFILTLEFIGRHDSSYIQNLNIPEIIVENNNLILELNTLSQLNIVGKSLTVKKGNPESVFDVINFTQTSIGKRHLHSLLCKPFKDSFIIKERYNTTEELGKISNKLDTSLKNISDFEKLHRKMALELLHPREFNKLDMNYNLIIDIIDCIKQNCNLDSILLSDDEVKHYNEYISDYKLKFNLSIMDNIDLNTNKDEILNYFNKGIIPELDIIQDKIDKIEEKRSELQLFYHNQLCNTVKGNNNHEMVKLVYTENEGYAFTCTKIRYELLLKRVKELEKCRVRHNNSVTKFYPEELLTLCNELINYRELLHKKVKMYYLNNIKEYYNKYNGLFKRLREFIEIIDVCNSNIKCKEKYNYSRPELIENNASYFEACQLRHPIIERLGTNYIPNDVKLDHESMGMLLYGLNSSGKSSLLRAIGINVILAQCGLYVPCQSFKFSPFHTIISQVDLTDNLFSGKSSYINETLGLKRILKCADDNTLVLCDEMCKGTEYNSSVSLVASTLIFLLNKCSKVFFTSHLHEIARQDEIKELSTLKICHMDVSIRNNRDIIFERLLRDGIGSELYGLEVAKSLLEEPELIDIAFNIRNRLVGNNTEKFGKKRSNYNKKKIMKKCEICSSTKNLETDHMMPQCDTDDKGFVNDKHYHKNEIFNLAVLCKSCHLKKTQGKIIINGYKDSINGRFLDYTEN